MSKSIRDSELQQVSVFKESLITAADGEAYAIEPSFRIPEFDASWRWAAWRRFGRQRSIDFCDEWRLVQGKEVLDAWYSCHKCVGEVREGRRTDDHQQDDAMPQDGILFVRLVADAAIMGRSDLPALSHRL